jgi:hypothetical protein
LWEWEQPRDWVFQHRVVEHITGVQGVGSCCAEGVTHDGYRLHLCFAPGTPEWYVDYISRLIFGDFLPAYDAGGRWSSTSYGSTGSTGNPIQLRWSFVPDGTLVPGLSNDSAPSNLIASMNSKFGGNTTLWQNQFRNSFARWSQVAGLRYTEVSDDGAAFPNNAGSATAPRGDVRIGGRSLDGINGVLAFNYLPNVGDMVIDTSEGWQSNTSSYRFLRNTVMHEHGHGIGLLHVVPITETKLMEPYLSLRFDGPQDDDIRGAHRYYGDPYEVNGTIATATPIDLTNTNLATLGFASLDRTGDVDFYRLIVPPSRRITITVTPVGGAYQVGGDDGSPPQSTIDTRAIQNLQLELRAPERHDGAGVCYLERRRASRADCQLRAVPCGRQLLRARVLGHRFHKRCAAVRAARADREPARRRCGRQQLRGRRGPIGNPVQLRRQRPRATTSTATTSSMTPTCCWCCSTSAAGAKYACVGFFDMPTS